MISKEEIQKILNDSISENVVCYKHEFRPSEIAKGIRKIANVTDDYGFIVIGASIIQDKYVVIGLSKGFNIDRISSMALKELTIAPDVESACLDLNGQYVYVIKVYKAPGGTALTSDRLQDGSISVFINDLYNICIKLQGNAKYINASEDERNDYIRDMLEQRDYDVHDQTRRGISETGKSSGEIDIFVKKDNAPFTIIEALILSSLEKSYLSTHLNKIYSYDTTGNLFNVCLVYLEAKNLAGFWEKYCEFVTHYDYPYPIISFDDNIDNDYLGSEIKIMTTTHNRSGQKTILYHICVKILS